MSKQTIEVIVPPTSQALISGAILAQIFGKGSPRLVRLTYTDGETEEAYLTVGEISAGKENWFSIVSTVQAARQKAIYENNA